VNPQWSSDGPHVYFISDPGGISNVFRVEVASGAVSQITDVAGGVAGLTGTAPALSVAAQAPAMAFTVYRDGKYAMEFHRAASTLAGRPVEGRLTADADALPHAGGEGLLARLLDDHATGLPPTGALRTRAYAPDLSLEAVGQPYLSSGGGSFGSFVRGGGSLVFGDLLGERKLAMSVQVGSRLRDLALGTYFLNRERRWNWGALAELEPSIRRFPRTYLAERSGQPALIGETRDVERIQLRGAGLLSYPFNHVQRLEFTAGVWHARYREHVRSSARSLTTGRVLDRTEAVTTSLAPATVGEMSAALVGDTSVSGPTGPVLGSRYRFEVAPAIGDLSLTRVLVDYRRYVMPVKPYALAARVMHLGQYGRDAHDPRLAPTFLGSRYFVRGYGWSSLRCEWTAEGACAALEELLGSRLLIGNAELRVPLLGIRSRDLTYGPLPAEAFLFADSGVVWSRPHTLAAAGTRRRVIRSVGAGIRVRAFALPLELAAVRALDPPARGWSFDFSFRPGF
jgi:hypothetical protein